MKKIVIALVTLCLVISCSKSDDSIDQTPVTEGKGNIAFSFSINNSRLNKDSGNAVYSKMDQIPFQIIVTIFDDNGNGSYTTENIELTTGNYVLTGFNVVNADNEVILSAPIEGSEFADLVTTPLPISFTVNEGATSTLNPEVLRIEPEDTPEQFGYVSFTFNVIETVNLYIQLLENGESVSAGSVKIGNIPDNDFIERDLSVGVNTIRIPLND